MINERELLQEIEMLEDSIKQVMTELEPLKSTVSQSVMLRAIRHGSGYQYFQRRKGSETNGEYIRKKEITKAVTLAQIEYDERLLNALQEAKRQLEKCKSTGVVNPFETALEQMMPGKRELVTPYYIPDETYIKNWRRQKYEGLPFKEDFPEYYTRQGLKVRSKSEILIADILDEFSVPFLYEKPLELKRRTFYPDFTLLDIKGRKEVYWEHFGMMDDPDYVQNAIGKLSLYAENGIFPGHKLILTMETRKESLNTRDIKRIIQEYLK